MAVEQDGWVERGIIEIYAYESLFQNRAGRWRYSKRGKDGRNAEGTIVYEHGRRKVHIGRHDRV